MDFFVEQSVFARFPKVCIGIVVVENLNNVGSNASVTKFRESCEDSAFQSFRNQDLNAHPNLRIWRDVFRQMENVPKQAVCSVESLLTRVLKTGGLRPINKLVDLVNAVSLEQLVPMGAHDLKNTQGYLCIRQARPGDRFTLLNDTKSVPVPTGEIVYADEREVHTRVWVWQQGDQGKVTSSTTNAFCPIDGFSDVTMPSVLNARDRLASLVSMYFPTSKTKLYSVDSLHPRTTLE